MHKNKQLMIHEKDNRLQKGTIANRYNKTTKQLN